MQSLFKQPSTPVGDPSQSAPPYCGGLHVLVLNRVPLPQVTEQSLQTDQSDHIPSTNDSTTA